MGGHSMMEGPDLHAPSNVIVENTTGLSLPALKIVKYSGFGTSNPLVTALTSLNNIVAGVVQTSISNNSSGLITAFGNICNLNTSSFSPNQILYTTASGDITATITDVRIGQVLKVDASSGIIFINTVVLSNTFRTDSEIKVQYENNADALVFANLANINSRLITSLISGFEVTVDGTDPELINITAGKLYVTVLSGPETSTGGVVSRAEQLGIAHPVGQASRVTLDSNGDATVTAFTGNLTQPEKKAGAIEIKILSHLGGLISSPIDLTFTTISALFGDSPALNDKLFSDGTILQDGLSIVLTTDLTLGRAAGSEDNPFAPSRFTTPDHPRRVILSEELSPLDFFLSWMGNDENSMVISGIITDINPNNWDDPTVPPGVGAPTSTLAGNEAQNFSIHEADSDGEARLAVQYGRIKYSTLSDAVAGAPAEMSRLNSLFFLGVSFRGMLSVPRAATNLLTQAVFTPPISRHIETLRGSE